MKISITVVVLIAGMIAIAAGWVYQSRSKSEVSRPELDIPSDIDYFMTDLDYRVIDEAGILDYQFQSPYLEHYPQDDISRIEAPVVRVYENSGEWRVEAGAGKIFHRSNTMQLSDNVVMQKMGRDPLRVRSERIVFEPDRDLVVIDQVLVMESSNSRIAADAAVFDLDRQIYRLKNTKAIYYDQDS